MRWARSVIVKQWDCLDYSQADRIVARRIVVGEVGKYWRAAGLAMGSLAKLAQYLARLLGWWQRVQISTRCFREES